jgi:hypothetical protein
MSTLARVPVDAAFWLATCLEAAAEDCHASPEPGESVPAAASTLCCAAVVDDLDLEIAGPIVKHDVDLGMPGVFQGIGQSLLCSA